MNLKTITFQKTACGGRPAGFLTRWYRGVVYNPSHYCIIVDYDLYDDRKYNHVDGGIDPNTGDPIDKRELKGVTYIVDIDRLKAEYPTCETEAVQTTDKTLVTEVPLG